jgi:hypothetical protein
MLRLLRGIGLLLLIFTTFSQPARADIWDWFGDLSGAGTSTSRGNLAATLYCRGADAGKFQTLQHADDKGPCFFADVHRFKSDPEDIRFFPVRMEMYESGPTYRLAPAFEVGVGAGLIHFDSSGVNTNRFILTFPRFVLKPLLFKKNADNGNLGFIQMYFSENHIIGELNADDFRPKPAGVDFHVRHDLVPSTGFIIDAVALVRLVMKK